MECLEKQRAVLGDSHPTTKTTKNNLALLRKKKFQQTVYCSIFVIVLICIAVQVLLGRIYVI